MHVRDHARCERGEPQEGELPAVPLNPSNEMHAYQLIADRIEALLAEYPTTAEEDEFELSAMIQSKRGAASRSAGAANERRSAAVCATLLEKRLLTASLAAISAEVSQYVKGGELPGSGSPSEQAQRPRTKRKKKKRGRIAGSSSAAKTEL